MAVAQANGRFASESGALALGVVDVGVTRFGNIVLGRCRNQ